MRKKLLRVRNISVYISLLIVTAVVSCSNSSQRSVELKRFPVDSLDGIITRSGAELDEDDSSDGKGSLRIKARNAATVRLFEVNDLGVENAILTYQAKLRSEDLIGMAYLEMRCHFPDGREFFSSSPRAFLTGTTKWTAMQTLFTLRKGERPDVVKLNLIIEGKGTVWIDDIHLMKGPLV